MKTEALKKMVYVILGYVSTEPEKVKKLAKDIARSGKISEAEGHALVDEMIAKFQSMKANVEEKIGTVSKDALEKIHMLHSDKLDELGSRIAALEKSGIAKAKSILGKVYGTGNESASKTKVKTTLARSRQAAGKKALVKSRSKKSVSSHK